MTHILKKKKKKKDIIDCSLSNTLTVLKRRVLNFLLNSNHRATNQKTPNNKTKRKGTKTHSERSCSTVLFLGFVASPQFPMLHASPKLNGVLMERVCTCVSEILHLVPLPESLPHTESFSTLFFRPPSMYAQTRSSRHQNPKH